MTSGPSGVPRPLAEASLSVNMYYMGDQYSINEERLKQRVKSRLDNDPSGIVTAFVISEVESATTDIDNSTSREDTKVSVRLENPQGTIRRIVQEGRLGPVMEISEDVIDTVKQSVNAAVDDGAESTTLTIE